MTKLLIRLLLSASLWVQTPCLNGDGPLQVGQEYCLGDSPFAYIGDIVPLSPLVGHFDSWTLIQYTVFAFGDQDIDAFIAERTISKLRKRCEDESAQCSLIVIEKSGEELARMDLDGKWVVSKGTLAEALDVMNAAGNSR